MEIREISLSLPRKVKELSPPTISPPLFPSKECILTMHLMFTMPHSYIDIKKKVRQRIKERTLKSIWRHVKIAKPALWGSHRPRNHLRKAVVVALYKDMFAIGYRNLALDVKEWLKADEKTHGHNQKLLRKLFAEWAARKTSLGSLQEWERISAGSVPKSTKSPPHLFIDSTDFRRTGKKRTSKKSEKWSYKCNSPARRYMAITDASGRGRYISNGYSPKLYDAHWVQARQDWCERKLAGATVYADNHFYSAAKYLKQVRLIASKKKPTKREMDIHDKLMNQNIASTGWCIIYGLSRCK